MQRSAAIIMRDHAKTTLFTGGLALACLAMTLGCNSKQTTITETKTITTFPAPTYPARPAVTPPPFKLFHHNDTFLTLVTSDNATDDQIEAILWQLHDAAKAHTFDALHIPQKLIDARDPVVAIHIYRGTKCAAEGYANGAPPCGPSYHAAGDFTFGGFTNPNRTDGVLHQDATHDITLWNPDEH